MRKRFKKTVGTPGLVSQVVGNTVRVYLADRRTKTMAYGDATNPRWAQHRAYQTMRQTLRRRGRK